MKPALKINKYIPRRSLLLLFLCLIAWIILLIRLFQLQVIEYDKYQQNVISNIQKTTTLTAERGIIYDRNHIQIASNYTVYRVFISPKDIVDNEQAMLIATNLSEILDADYNDIIERAGKKNRADETIKKNVDEDTALLVRKFIAEYSLNRQIYLEANITRYYPYSTLASHLIGLIGTDGGLIGLERQYDSYLSGTPGKYITAKDAHGLSMPFKYDSYIDPTDGSSLVTTIDLTMQYLLEEQLQATYESSSPLNRVTGIIMDVNTGAIRAMATYPNFDLNSAYTLDADSQIKLDTCGYVPGTEDYTNYYKDLLYGMWRNKAISELYEPGSTFKIITSAMALQEKLVTVDETFNCTGKYYVEGYSKPINCHKLTGHGVVSFEVGLQQSCNPVLMTLAGRIGRENFYKNFQLFGYLEKTGIDLPGEASTYMFNYSNFNQVELATSSFGQGFKVTALRQLTSICAIANGGYLVTPYTVEQIIDSEGNVIESHEADPVRQVVSRDVCDTLSGILERGVSGDGGAKNAYVMGYEIAAKTGTSEVMDILDENGNSYLRVGSTVAYAPAYDPQIAAIIVVDQPQCEYVYGSMVAAPYIANLLNEVLPYLGVERSYTDEELQKLSVTIRSYVGWPATDAKQDAIYKGISYEVKGDGDVVTWQIPAGGEAVNREKGKIIFYTGDAVPVRDIAVPSVIGMTAANANKTLINAGLNISIDGTTVFETAGEAAYVTSQTPAANTLVTYGDVVTITLRYLDGTAN